MLNHEYLADEGVLRTGIDRLQYQALLVNQVAEGNFICLSSGFHHSLIKKRLIMMTKNKPDRDPKLRILTLVPIALLLFIGVAYMNGQKANTQTPVKQMTETKNKLSDKALVDTSYSSNAVFSIQHSMDGKSNIQSFFNHKFYQEVVKKEGKFYVQMDDKQIKTEVEYLAIKPEDVQQVVWALRTEKEKLEKYLKGNLQTYLNGNYGLAMIIIPKQSKKFSSWITENAYKKLILKDRLFVVCNDKHLTKEQYLALDPSKIIDIVIPGGVQTEKEKEKIKNYLKEKGLYDEFTAGNYGAVVHFVLKK